MENGRDNRLRVAVAILCYRNDSELLMECLRAAKTAFADAPQFEPKYILVDDAWCPVKKEVREKFLAEKDTLRIVTGHRRGEMILGGEYFTGQCRAFLDAAEKTDAEILVKLDCDTLLYKVDWLREFASDPKALIAGAFDFGNANHTSVFGLCYAIKRQALAPLLEDSIRFPAHHKAWEDHETSSRIFRIAGGDMDALMRWRANNAEDGFVVVPLAQANDSFINARAANFSWDFALIPPAGKAAYRKQVAQKMKQLNDLKAKPKEEVGNG